MQLNEHTAIVDNDFTNHLVDCRLPDQQLIDDLNIMFSGLDLAAVMHPLVYEKELLKDKPRVKLLFEQNVFSKAEFSDIFQGNAVDVLKIPRAVKRCEIQADRRHFILAAVHREFKGL